MEPEPIFACYASAFEFENIYYVARAAAERKMKMKNKIVLIIAAAMLAVIMVAASIPVFGSNVEPSLSIDGFNLSFEDNVYIKYAVKLNGTTAEELGNNFEMLFWTAPQTSYTKGSESFSAKSIGDETINGTSYEIFKYTELAAKNMTDDIYARAYMKIGESEYYSEIEKYSVLQYAYNMLGYTDEGTDNANLKTLLTEMLGYGAAAQKYFNYKTDRLATDRYYQIKVVGGTLPDGMTNGLYKAGEKFFISAPETDKDGILFTCWKNSCGTVVSLATSDELLVGNFNEVYTSFYDNSKHIWKIGTKISEATCKRSAMYNWSCVVEGCNEVKIESFGNPNPQNHGDLRDATIIEPTCGNSGSIEGYCNECQTYVNEVIPPNPQNHGDLRDATIIEPTCGNSGSIEGYCNECQTYVNEVVPQITDRHTGKVVDVLAIAPDCVTSGRTEGWHCTDCGEFEESQYLAVNPSVHAPDCLKYQILSIPGTCAADALNVYYWSLCGCRVYVPIPNSKDPDNHYKNHITWSNGNSIPAATNTTVPSTNVEVSIKVPTCTEAGYHAYTYCEDCGIITNIDLSSCAEASCLLTDKQHENIAKSIFGTSEVPCYTVGKLINGAVPDAIAELLEIAKLEQDYKLALDVYVMPQGGETFISGSLVEVIVYITGENIDVEAFQFNLGYNHTIFTFVSAEVIYDDDKSTEGIQNVFSTPIVNDNEFSIRLISTIKVGVSSVNISGSKVPFIKYIFKLSESATSIEKTDIILLNGEFVSP